LRELYKNLDLLGDIKKQILAWIGHLVRVDQGRTDKKIFQSNPEGSRRRERPRFRWLEDVEKDFLLMKVKRRYQKVVDREERASVIKETKVVRGPYSQEVSKNLC
jgi:hypothetical protein